MPTKTSKALDHHGRGEVIKIIKNTKANGTIKTNDW